MSLAIFVLLTKNIGFFDIMLTKRDISEQGSLECWLDTSAGQFFWLIFRLKVVSNQLVLHRNNFVSERLLTVLKNFGFIN